MNLKLIVSALIFVIGVINVLPIIVFFDKSRSERLYGVTASGESMAVLMRHRAVLLALIGSGLILSVFRPEFRLVMIIAALISKLVFIYLRNMTPNVSKQIGRVALVDVVSVVILAAVLMVGF